MRIAVACLLLACFAVGRERERDVPLPEGADTVVASWRVTPFGDREAPEVEVLADGRVLVAGELAEAALTPEELRDLMRFLVVEQDFFALDMEATGRTLKRNGWPPPRCPMGETTTHLTVRVKGREATKRMLLLDTVAGRFPDLDAPKVLVAVRERLRLEGRFAAGGGRARIDGWRTLANRRLKQRRPGLRPFELVDFTGLVDVPGGEMALLPSMDPHLAEVHGRCAAFSYTRDGSPHIVSALVRVAEHLPRVAVSVQR